MSTPHRLADDALQLSSVTLPTGRVVDVVVNRDSVCSVEPAAGSGVGLDLSGYLLLPALAEPHAHLDKALSWSAIAAPTGDLQAAVSSWAAWGASQSAGETAARVQAALRLLLQHGCTAVRTHVDVAAGPAPLRSLEVMVELREQLRGLIDLQVVAFALPGVPDQLLADALACGSDLMGGLAHLADDPVAEHGRLFRAAEKAGVGLDLHTDEQLDPRVLTVTDVIARVAAGQAPGPVTVSHCSSLGVVEAAVQASVAAALAAARIAVTTMPQTNLYLLGRGLATSPPRGLTAVATLRKAGVVVAAGGDNLRDPFNPMGRGDPLETASLMVSAGHLDVPAAFATVSTEARLLLGLPPAGPECGSAADLLAVRAPTLDDAVAGAPPERVVIKSGRVVSRTHVQHDSELDRRWPAPDNRWENG